LAHFEFVGNVEFVGVEEEEDEVGPLREPLDHAHEVVAAPDPLLLAREHARGVHEPAPARPPMNRRDAHSELNVRRQQKKRKRRRRWA
jgi:hypothetical protein